jgi:hypothetical protein
MCATGLLKDDPDHAAQMVRFAQEMQRQAAQVLMPDGSGQPVRVRVGIHSGPLLSGVIGRIRKRYCVVGSTVNLASRCAGRQGRDKWGRQRSSTRYRRPYLQVGGLRPALARHRQKSSGGGSQAPNMKVLQ